MEILTKEWPPPLMQVLPIQTLVSLATVARQWHHLIHSSLPTLAAAWRITSGVFSLPFVELQSLQHLARLHVIAASQLRHCAVGAGEEHALLISSGTPFLLGKLDKDCTEGLVRPNCPWMQADALATIAKMPTQHPIVSVACGARHALLLDTFGAVLSCGAAGDGQLGHNDICSQQHPRYIAALAGKCVVQISAGHAHNLALASSLVDPANRDLYTWGLNEEGQLGLGNRADAAVPALIPKFSRPEHQVDIKSISCGDFHSAVVTAEGALYTWGYGRAGRLGHESEDDVLVPQAVNAPHSFLDVECGAAFTVAIVGLPGQFPLWVTGQGWDGQLGIGVTGQGAFTTFFEPVHVPSPLPLIRHVSARDGIAVLLDNDTALVWGNTGPLAGDRVGLPKTSPALRGAHQVALGGRAFAVSIDKNAQFCLCHWESGVPTVTAIPLES